MTRPPGHGTRKLIARLVGVAIAAVACIAVYALVFAGIMRELEKAGETARVWWILAFVGLVLGSGANSLTFWLLDRRARRAAEDARLPRARVER